MGPEGWEAQNYALFSSPATMFFLFSLSWGSLRGILVVFLQTGALKCSRLEFSGCRVKPWRHSWCAMHSMPVATTVQWWRVLGWRDSAVESSPGRECRRGGQVFFIVRLLLTHIIATTSAHAHTHTHKDNTTIPTQR